MFSTEYVMGDSTPMNPEAGSQFLKIGSKFRIHNSAPGKAVLSELASEEVEGILELQGFPATTENTLTDRDEFIEDSKRFVNKGMPRTTRNSSADFVRSARRCIVLMGPFSEPSLSAVQPIGSK